MHTQNIPEAPNERPNTFEAHNVLSLLVRMGGHLQKIGLVFLVETAFLACWGQIFSILLDNFRVKVEREYFTSTISAFSFSYAIPYFCGTSFSEFLVSLQCFVSSSLRC